MAQHVCMGAMMACSFGAAPGSLVVLPVHLELSSGPPGGNISDCAPIINVPPFAVCNSLANPEVAAATAAALGVLTPMPCLPVPSGTWTPGDPTAVLGGLPMLDSTSKLMCAYGGVIQITVPGEFTISIS